MKKGLWFGFFILSFVFLLVGLNGCGKKPTSSAKGVVNLRFENWEVTPQQLKLWQEVVDRFHASHPNIRVAFQPIQGGPDKILVEMAGGSAPDIFFWDTHLLSSLVKKNSVVNLAPFIKETKVKSDDYFLFAWSGCVYGKGIFAMPCYWGASGIAYNKSLFDKAKVPYPTDNWTWDDYLSIARKLTVRKDGRFIQYGGTAPFIDPTRVGEAWFDGAGRLNESRALEELMQFVQDLRYKYKIAPQMAGVPLQEYYRQEMELFMTGKVAMFNCSSWTLPVLKDIKNFDWDVAAMPKWKGRNNVLEEGSGVLCVAAQSKNPKEAFEFVRFACGKESQEILGRGHNNPPALKEVAYRVFTVPPPENIKVYLTQSEGAKVISSPARFSWYSEWLSRILAPETDKLLLNKQDAAETLKNLKAATSAFLKEQR